MHQQETRVTTRHALRSGDSESALHKTLHLSQVNIGFPGLPTTAGLLFFKYTPTHNYHNVNITCFAIDSTFSPVKILNQYDLVKFNKFFFPLFKPIFLDSGLSHGFQSTVCGPPEVQKFKTILK